MIGIYLSTRLNGSHLLCCLLAHSSAHLVTLCEITTHLANPCIRVFMYINTQYLKVNLFSYMVQCVSVLSPRSSSSSSSLFLLLLLFCFLVLVFTFTAMVLIQSRSLVRLWHFFLFVDIAHRIVAFDVLVCGSFPSFAHTPSLCFCVRYTHTHFIHSSVASTAC